MKISRFSKFFLLTIILILLSSLFFLHRPILAYRDPWSGNFFGEGGVNIHEDAAQYQRMDGAVIMGKLGNETAK